jgi:MFS family permease
MNFEHPNILYANKRGIVVALTLATFLAAVDTTIVTMATPVITRDLNGFDLVSLIFSVYLLTSSVATPIFGKLADLYGRKRVLNVGILLFLIGSVCCGLSLSMGMLIISRAIQGLGAASVYTVSMTIAGDVFDLDQRAKFQGVLLSVWGIAGLLGPFLGGVIIDLLTWHWIFYINIPFGLLSLVVISRSLKERVIRLEHKIDYAGALVLSAALIVFLGIFTIPGFIPLPFEVYAGGSLVVTAGLILVFVQIERRAQEPLIEVELLTQQSIFVNLTAFLAGVLLICIDVYMPIFLQNAQGHSATISGLMAVPETLSWLVFSFMLAHIMRRFGGKTAIVVSSFFLIITSLLFLTLDVSTTLLALGMINFVAGFAIGGVYCTSTIIIQDSVGYEQRGAAIALNSLVKNLGATIGIGILGGVYNLSITRFFQDQGMPDIDPSNIYSAGEVASAGGEGGAQSSSMLLTQEQIAQCLANATRMLFLVCLVVSVLAFIASLLIPKMPVSSSKQTKEN